MGETRQTKYGARCRTGDTRAEERPVGLMTRVWYGSNLRAQMWLAGECSQLTCSLRCELRTRSMACCWQHSSNSVKSYDCSHSRCSSDDRRLATATENRTCSIDAHGRGQINPVRGSCHCLPQQVRTWSAANHDTSPLLSRGLSHRYRRLPVSLLRLSLCRDVGVRCMHIPQPAAPAHLPHVQSRSLDQQHSQVNRSCTHRRQEDLELQAGPRSPHNTAAASQCHRTTLAVSVAHVCCDCLRCCVARSVHVRQRHHRSALCDVSNSTARRYSRSHPRASSSDSSNHTCIRLSLHILRLLPSRSQATYPTFNVSRRRRRRLRPGRRGLG